MAPACCRAWFDGLAQDSIFAASIRTMIVKDEGIAGGLAFAAILLVFLTGCPEKQEPARVPEQAMALVSAPSSSHEPPGFTPRWQAWDGATLPVTRDGCKNPNRFGMCGWADQARTLSAVRDASGSFMRTLYPGRTSPIRDSIWLPPDFGGRAPSRWMWNTSLPAGSTRLYVRATFRISDNWSQWGAHADSGFRRTRRYNVGTKFFFPRARGITAEGDTIDSNQNDLINLITAGDYRGDSISSVWHVAGAPSWEAIDLRYMEQRNPGGSRNLLGVPVTNCNPTPGCQSGWLMQTPSTCTRGQWCTAEVLLSYGTPGDSASTFTTWLNGALIRAGTFRTPAHGNRSNVTVPLTKVWFSYVWSDMTFGGGRLIPWEDQSIDLREFYVSVAP